MKKYIRMIAITFIISLISGICVFGSESDFYYDTLPNWGISIASPADTTSVLSGNDYNIYFEEEGYIPYVRVNVYNGYPDNDEYEFLDELTAYMSEDYDDLEIITNQHEIIIDGIPYYEVCYDFTIEGHHVLDRRIAKKVGKRMYLFTSKEVEELNMTIGNMLNEIISNSSFLDEDGRVIEMQQKSEEPDADTPIEVLLTVTVEDLIDGAPDKEPTTRSYAYIAKTGDVIDIGGLSDLVITCESVYNTSVIFSTNEKVFRESGDDAVTDRFIVFYDKTLHIWNDCLAGAKSDYYFEIADVDVASVEDMGRFDWDVDLDGNPEEAFISFTDRGSNVLSFSYLHVSDPETGSSWEAYMDGVHDISNIHTVQGSGESFLTIDALYDDYDVQDQPVSLVAVFENNEINIY